ncbi:hypothetical protein MOX01_22660 [Microbacterium oxydans]|uniref:hypothetical protein n=1 Tax=Microbacterium oxydans TaxID=82380 RepID=UPI0011757C78|nr:hypothetical protein [Microbacterium oxydans]GED39124.1 hypothetical protein MOX01_22660 [Microbacterium oxydans]
MTDTFTASNGIEVTVDPDREGKVYLVGRRARGDEGQYLDTHATGGPEGIVALREFFQHERDEELGRWRWPEHREYVVYASRRPILVLNELTGDTLRAHRADGFSDSGHGTIYNAASAYFESHPERKPWEDAEPGEVWELQYEQLGEPRQTRAFTVDSLGHLRNTSGVRMASLHITAGRRIWPEDAS